MTSSTLEIKKKEDVLIWIYIKGSDKLWWRFSLTFFLIWYYLEINYSALDDFTSISSNYFKCVINPFLIDTVSVALSTFWLLFSWAFLSFFLKHSSILWINNFSFSSYFVFFHIFLKSFGQDETLLILTIFIKVCEIQFKNNVFLLFIAGLYFIVLFN